MNEKICKNCKYWIENNYILNGYEKDYNVCSIITFEDNNKAEAICASESISGELITKFDFGCVLHELK